MLGVIYIPVKEILFYGSSSGVFKIEQLEPRPDISLEELRNRSILLPSELHSGDYIMVASRSHMNAETLNYIEELRQQRSSVKLIFTGSSAKICLVADGSADIYPHFAPTMEWDIAAGHAIIKAMGKNIYQMDGHTPLVYNKEDFYNSWFIVK